MVQPAPAVQRPPPLAPLPRCGVRSACIRLCWCGSLSLQAIICEKPEGTDAWVLTTDRSLKCGGTLARAHTDTLAHARTHADKLKHACAHTYTFLLLPSSHSAELARQDRSVCCRVL